MTIARRAGFCIGLGAALFIVGFRLTSEVVPVLLITMMTAGVVGLAMGDRPWLWGLCFGIGTRIGGAFEPPLSPEHVQKYGPSKPIPLPLGLTESGVAQYLAGSLLIVAFPFVATVIGWAVGRLWSVVNGRRKPSYRISAH